MWSDRRIRAAVLACCILVGCGGTHSTSVRADTSSAPARSAETAPSTVADQYIARAHTDRLVARGCVRPDQVPGTSLTAASVICIYQRAFAGEIRVGLVADNGTWRVIGQEDVTA